MAENSTFNQTVDSLIKGMDAFVSSKTVVGDPIQVGDTMLIPLVDISFGMGAGAFIGEKKKNSAGGMGAKISPNAILVIKPDGTTKIVSTGNQDAISKILDMIPDYVNKFSQKWEEKKDPEGFATKAAAKADAAEDLKEKLNLD